MPVVQPPALPTGFASHLPLTNTRPPLQTTIYKHLFNCKSSASEEGLTRRDAAQTPENMPP